MAIGNTGFADVVAYYGTSARCTKFLLSPTDWADAQQAPDAAMWALSAQSGTIVDKSKSVAALMMGNPGTTTAGVFSKDGDRLEEGYAINNKSLARKYPGPF
jgi:hypothetical protein